MTDMIEVEDLVKCPACGGAFDDHTRHGNSMTLEDQPHVYQHCSVCGVWALNPRMTDAFTKEYYGGQYRDARPIEPNILMWQVTRAKTQYGLVGDLMRGKTYLELGSSSGYLMREFYYRGFACTSVDPDPDSGAMFADLSEVPPEPYDIIAMSHVFEHFNHPLAVLKTLARDYAYSGTRIMIDVPNLTKAKENAVFQIHHPFAYDLDNLTKLLEMAGCKVIFSAVHGDGLENEDNLLVVAEVQ